MGFRILLFKEDIAKNDKKKTRLDQKNERERIKKTYTTSHI